MSSPIQCKWQYSDDINGFNDSGWAIEYSTSLKGSCHLNTYGQYEYSWQVYDLNSRRMYSAKAGTLEDGKNNVDRLAFLFILEKVIYGERIGDRIESLE